MRALQAAGFVAGLTLVFAALVMWLPADARPPQGNIRVISRLDEFTRVGHPDAANTLPTFLSQPGLLGALPAAPVPEGGAESSEPRVYTTRDIKPINEVELQKGFCTANLARLIRQQFPGSYDGIPDAELEKTVIKKRPEYQDRLCVLPVWVDAAPSDIVKYELEPAVLNGGARTWRAGFITAALGALAFVVYWRLKTQGLRLKA